MTNSANATATKTSATTSAPSVSTCCYLWPAAVGVNTWWSSSANLTTATVITTWIQYNNTIVPGNSTTIYVSNATSFYGSMGGGLYETYTEVGPPTATTTVSGCAYDPVHDPCTRSTTSVVTLRSHSRYAYQTTSISGVPAGLLPLAADLLYGATFIDNATAATFPSQSLTIQSPTPFFQFRGIGLWTSRECVEPVTITSETQYIRTTIEGTLVKTSSFFPTYTSTPLPSGVFLAGGNVLGDNATVARAFPDGDYSDFNFTAWMEGIVSGPTAGMVDAYTFFLDSDLAKFFAAIPYVSEMFTDVDIATCQPLLGGGEPSVHVPVNQLIATSHKTITSAGTLPQPTTADPNPPTTDVPTFTSPVVEPTGGTTVDEPEPGTTTSPNTPPADTTNVQQPQPAPEPTTSSNDEPTNTASPDQPAQQLTAQPVQNGGGPDDSNDADSTPNQQATTALPAQDQNPRPTAQATSTGVGDIIASVIGLVPGAVSGQQADDQEATPPTITIGNNVVTANSALQFVVGSQTLVPGGSAITADGTTYAIPTGGSAIVANGVTTLIDAVSVQVAETPAPQITIGGSAVKADDSGDFVVGSQTLAAGGSAITVDGSTYSLAPSGTALVVNGQTSQIAIPQGSPVTIGVGLATPIASGAYVLPGGETLSVGGSPVTLDGTTYSLALSRSVVIDGVTSPIPAAGGTITGLPDVSQGSITELVLSGTTLLPGSNAVIAGTTYSLPLSGGGIYINGESSALATASPGSPITLPNGVVATPAVVSDVVIGSQTLVPGGLAVTISGTTYSVSGSEVIVAAPLTTYIEDSDDFDSEATATSTRRSSSERTSSPTAMPAGSSQSVTGGSAPSVMTTSGGSRSFGLLDAMCATICSLAFLMCLL